MKRYGRALALAVAMVILAGACTSDPDKATDDGGGGAGGSTKGLTDETIKIGFIGADFGPLAEAGIAPDLGDQPTIVQAVVDAINNSGGVAGRKIEVRIKLVDGTAGPEAGQAACLEMTQDFGAFAVIIAPAVGRDTARCVAVTNETLALGATGFDAGVYEEAEGRLFTAGSDTSMSTNRQYEGWAQLMDDEGVLDGKTIGVVSAEQSPEFTAAVKDGLVPKLKELGHEVAVDVTLPCPEGDTDCDQHEAAVQQMKDAGVDFVFMAAPNLSGPTFLTAAENLDFAPQWAANGNQVTDTVSTFFESVKDAWDGAIGTSTVFAEVEDLTNESRLCNEIVKAGGGEDYEPGSDAYGFAAVNCLLLQLLQNAGREVEKADLNQATMIEAIEGLGSIELNAGPEGSLSPDKHDAGDYLFLADYDADAGEFVQRRDEPVKIDG